MDSYSFDLQQADSFDSASRSESYRLFTFYHPGYQPDAPLIPDDRECLGESTYHHHHSPVSVFQY